MRHTIHMTNKTLYVETDSLEFKEAKVTGWLRCIVGDAIDEDIRAAQYKGKRRQQFFSHWDIKSKRDHAVHDQLKRVVFTDRVVHVDTDGDVQSREAFDFKVDRKWSQARMKQFVTEVITKAVDEINGEQKQSVTFIPTTWQRRVIEFIANSLDEGKKTLLLELAARFGKTGTLTQLFEYSDADVMVVANYVKTVNTSFADTAVKFFSNSITCVDAKDADFDTKLQSALDAGRKVLVTCSLFSSDKIDACIDKISTIPNRFVVVDEADFGSHTPTNLDKVERLRKDVPLLLMTGTNADRAASAHDIDAHIAITYFDMLMEVDS